MSLAQFTWMPYIVNDEDIDALNKYISETDEDVLFLTRLLSAEIVLSIITIVFLVAVIAIDVYKMRKKHLKNQGLLGITNEYEKGRV